MASKKQVGAAPVTFCTNCGQMVAGAIAQRSHDTDVQFCWNCGMQLDDEGKCQNEDCKFFGKDPGAPPA